MDLKFHHIAIAVEDLEVTQNFYLKLGFKASEPIVDENQDVKLVFLRKEHHPLLELVNPNSEGSPIINTLRKVGVSPYHICYEVDDLQAALEYFRANKFIITRRPTEAIAFGGRLIAFVYSQATGLIELLQS